MAPSSKIDSGKYRYRLVNVSGYITRRKCRHYFKISVIVFCLLLLILLVFLFIVFPLIFMNSIELQRNLMFTHFGLPDQEEYFENFNLTGKRNFYIPVHDLYSQKIVFLGVWHLLPHNLTKLSTIQKDFNYNTALRSSNFSILLYFHGTGEARSYQVGKYKVLRNFFHIITFDYRSYADSTKATLSEDAVVSDCIQLYQWLADRTDSKIFVWGHSLGTSLATRTVANLKTRKPKGLILESPFTSMRDELYHHPLSSIFKWLPWFEITVVRPLERNGFIFNTSEFILKIDSPIMLLCAEDDSIVPYELTRQLFQIVKENGLQKNTVVYHQFSYLLHYNHFFLYKDPATPFLIRYFLYLCNNFVDKEISS